MWCGFGVQPHKIEILILHNRISISKQHNKQSSNQLTSKMATNINEQAQAVQAQAQAAQPLYWSISENEKNSIITASFRVISASFSRVSNTIFVIHKVNNKNICKKYPCTREQWYRFLKSSNKERSITDLITINSYIHTD